MSDLSPRADGAKPVHVHVQNLSKVFTTGDKSFTALTDVDLTIRKSEFVCLLGASGCGKSTLLRLIAGFETPTTGGVSAYGLPITGPGPERGIVFQDYALFPWLTVRENIAFGPKHAGLGRKTVTDITDKFMAMVGLTEFAERYPSQLSGGMKQRVAIARVLANDTDMLLMDEPFGALDALTRTKLQEELLDIWAQAKLTVVFVTHSVEEAVELADRIIVMSASPGRVSRDIRIDLPRPRDVASLEFNEIRREVSQMLTSNIAPGRRLTETASA